MFWLSKENIYVCTIIWQLLVCRIVMQLNEKWKVSHLTYLFSTHSESNETIQNVQIYISDIK